MARIVLFILTNAAILVVISVVFRLLGLDGALLQNSGIDMTSLLIMAAIVGFSGSLISLFLSKTMAKRGMGVQIIDQPTNSFEQWLLNTVANQSGQAGIRMPEVGIRHQMANALRALQRVHKPQDLPAGEFAAFGISGKIGDGLMALFRSHPPLEKRIAALEQTQY